MAAQIELPENVKMGMPGDNLTIKLNLQFPLPIATGQRFALREGGRTIAAGVVSKVLQEEAPKDTPKDDKKPAPAGDKKPAVAASGDKKPVAGDKKPAQATATSDKKPQ